MKVLWEKRKLILDLAKADFKKRFVGSYLGIFWIFVQPVVTIIIYYYIFQLGFKSNPQADVPYVVWLLPGIIPWFFFNEAVMNGTVSMLNYQHLVKKMVFPIKIIPGDSNRGIIIYPFYICWCDVSSYSFAWSQTEYLVASVYLLYGMQYITNYRDCIFIGIFERVYKRYCTVSEYFLAGRVLACTDHV